MSQFTEKISNPINNSQRSDIPTETFMTPKAIIFYLSSIVTVLCLFLNWLPIDLDLGYIQLDDILGTVNAFTVFGSAQDLENAIGIMSALLPDGVTAGFTIMKIAGICLMICGGLIVALYAYAIYLRTKGSDNCVRVGKMAALSTIGTVVLFIVVLMVCLAAMDMMEILGHVIGKVLTGPCVIMLVTAVISGICAVRDTKFKENVVIYHTGVMKIDKGPLWKCDSCHRKNLSLLQKCFYCGKER